MTLWAKSLRFADIHTKSVYFYAIRVTLAAMGQDTLRSSSSAPATPPRTLLHVATPPRLLARLDELVGDVSTSRSEAARLAIVLGLGVLEERRAGRDLCAK